MSSMLSLIPHCASSMIPGYALRCRCDFVVVLCARSVHDFRYCKVCDFFGGVLFKLCEFLVAQCVNSVIFW